VSVRSLVIMTTEAVKVPLSQRFNVRMIVFAAVAGFGWILLNRTPYGRYVVAVGGNTEAARSLSFLMK